MRFTLVYFSRGGKTRKVAEAIGQELGCQALDVDKGIPDISGTDVLIVGSGTYGGMPGPKITEFLNRIEVAEGGKAAVFTTSAGPSPRSIPNMKGALERKGYTIVSSFDCRGHFLLINNGHPNEKDMEKAKEFARGLM